MAIINSDEEFEEFYHYKYVPSGEYPEKYPCFCWKEHFRVGHVISDHDHVTHHTIYVPSGITNLKDFFIGLELGTSNR